MCSTKRVQLVVLFLIAAAFLAGASAHAGKLLVPAQIHGHRTLGVGRVLRGTYPSVGAVSHLPT